LLLACARFIKDESLVQELLFARLLDIHTKGESVYGGVQFFGEKGIPLRNILSCANNGAPSMVGRCNGFIAYLKKTVPDVFTIHCHSSPTFSGEKTK
jgi:hypothetical protein